MTAQPSKLWAPLLYQPYRGRVLHLPGVPVASIPTVTPPSCIVGYILNRRSR